MRALTRLCCCALIGLIAVIGLSVPAQARTEAAIATCDYAVGGEFDVVLSVPRTALGGQLGCADVRSRIVLGPVSSQSGPHHDSTTWSWEFCVWVWSPSGLIFEWCFKITITVSTDVPGAGTINVGVLSARHGSSPVKFCWEEKLPSGAVAKHCVEITIDIG